MILIILDVRSRKEDETVMHRLINALRKRSIPCQRYQQNVLHTYVSAFDKFQYFSSPTSHQSTHESNSSSVSSLTREKADKQRSFILETMTKVYESNTNYFSHSNRQKH